MIAKTSTSTLIWNNEKILWDDFIDAKSPRPELPNKATHTCSKPTNVLIWIYKYWNTQWTSKTRQQTFIFILIGNIQWLCFDIIDKKIKKFNLKQKLTSIFFYLFQWFSKIYWNLTHWNKSEKYSSSPYKCREIY